MAYMAECVGCNKVHEFQDEADFEDYPICIECQEMWDMWGQYPNMNEPKSKLFESAFSYLNTIETRPLIIMLGLEVWKKLLTMKHDFFTDLSVSEEDKRDVLMEALIELAPLTVLEAWCDLGDYFFKQGRDGFNNGRFEYNGKPFFTEKAYIIRNKDNFKGYNAESFTPPSSAVANAKKGLEMRKKWGRGGLTPAEAKSQGIDSGITRARKIASGKVSKHDVKRMSAFNRHRKNYRPSVKKPDGGPTAGTIAWLLWGGTSGVNWAKKKSKTLAAETYQAESDTATLKKYEKTYGKKGAKVRLDLKNKIMKQNTHGTKSGQWSARKSQKLKKDYEKAMEKKGLKPYKSSKKTESQKDLKEWGDQDWKTKSGKKSSVTGERYLPSKAIDALTDKEYKRTSAAKRKAKKAGKQFSKQPKDIAKKVAKYRAEEELPFGVCVVHHKTTSTVYYRRKPFRKFKGNRHKQQAVSYAEYMANKLKDNPNRFNYISYRAEDKEVRISKKKSFLDDGTLDYIIEENGQCWNCGIPVKEYKNYWDEKYQEFSGITLDDCPECSNANNRVHVTYKKVSDYGVSNPDNTKAWFPLNRNMDDALDEYFGINHMGSGSGFGGRDLNYYLSDNQLKDFLPKLKYVCLNPPNKYIISASIWKYDDENDTSTMLGEFNDDFIQKNWLKELEWGEISQKEYDDRMKGIIYELGIDKDFQRDWSAEYKVGTRGPCWEGYTYVGPQPYQSGSCVKNAEYTPEQEIQDYSIDQLMKSSAVEGDFTQDSLKYSVVENLQAEDSKKKDYSKLNPKSIQADAPNGWKIISFYDEKNTNYQLQRVVKCKSFEEVKSLIKTINQIADKLNHHPLVKYQFNSVVINLWTHDTNSLTDLDFKFANKINDFLDATSRMGGDSFDGEQYPLDIQFNQLQNYIGRPIPWKVDYGDGFGDDVFIGVKVVKGGYDNYDGWVLVDEGNNRYMGLDTAMAWSQAGFE